jgi:hypothetical protein
VTAGGVRPERHALTSVRTTLTLAPPEGLASHDQAAVPRHPKSNPARPRVGARARSDHAPDAGPWPAAQDRVGGSAPTRRLFDKAARSGVGRRSPSGRSVQRRASKNKTSSGINSTPRTRSRDLTRSGTGGNGHGGPGPRRETPPRDRGRASSEGRQDRAAPPARPASRGRRRVGVVKPPRARGGCLGVIRLSRAWKAAIGPGERPNTRRSRDARARPGELKHLSTRRNGKQPRLPQ